MTDEASHGFLGEEFLTWLWFRAETSGGELPLGDGKTVGFTIDDLIEFAPLDEDETQSAVKRGSPTKSAVARAALKSGRRLRKARLILAVEDRVYSATVDGPTLSFSSVKLPDDDPDLELAERSEERAQAFLELESIVDVLYRQFLELRLDRSFQGGEGERQANWMAGSARS
ncbi:MAG: hypothetical protein AAF196_10815 [Planctomycetota bacterium]